MKHAGLCILTAAALYSVASAEALSQGLPWQNGQQSQSASGSSSSNNSSSQSQTHHHKHSQSQSSQSSNVSNTEQRKEDDRKLDELANQFYGISATEPHAIDDLKKLEKQVSQFSDDLKKRSYNSTDIFSDTEKLENRIASQRKELEAQAAAKQKQTEDKKPSSGDSQSSEQPQPGDKQDSGSH